MSESLEALDITKDQLDGLLPKGLTPSMKWNIKTIEKDLKEKDYIQKALDKIVDHCEIGFGGGKDEDGNWVIYLMFPNQQDITILCKDKEEYDFWVKYADM